MPPGYGVDDGVALLFCGDHLAEAVSARRGAGAYWVEQVDSETLESPLDTVALPSREELAPPTPVSIDELREARALRRGRSGRGARFRE